MTMTVSVSEFRQNLSKYLEEVSRGTNIIIKDDKKDRELAQVTRSHHWDPKAYGAMLKRIAAHPLSSKDHPEWATRAKLEKWLRKSRMDDERKFDVLP